MYCACFGSTVAILRNQNSSAHCKGSWRYGVFGANPRERGYFGWDLMSDFHPLSSHRTPHVIQECLRVAKWRSGTEDGEAKEQEWSTTTGAGLLNALRIDSITCARQECILRPHPSLHDEVHVSPRLDLAWTAALPDWALSIHVWYGTSENARTFVSTVPARSVELHRITRCGGFDIFRLSVIPRSDVKYHPLLERVFNASASLIAANIVTATLRNRGSHKTNEKLEIFGTCSYITGVDSACGRLSPPAFLLLFQVTNGVPGAWRLQGRTSA
jgi:hypothetical protein